MSFLQHPITSASKVVLFVSLNVLVYCVVDIICAASLGNDMKPGRVWGGIASAIVVFLLYLKTKQAFPKP